MNELQNSLGLLSISAAAKELNIGTASLQGLIENGEIGVYILPNGRKKIAYAELNRWIREKKTYIIKENFGERVNTVEPFNVHEILFDHRRKKQK